MRNNEVILKDAIKGMIKHYNLSHKVNESKIINTWEKQVGKMISKHTTNVFLDNRKLFISLDSAPLRQELLYAREKMVKIINENLGENVIDEIILR